MMSKTSGTTGSRRTKARYLTETAVLTALLIVLQAVTKPAGQYVTGACVNAVVKGINKKKRKEMMEKGLLPVPVHAEIFQRNGYKTVVFALDEE